jgi:cytochrome c55X
VRETLAVLIALAALPAVEGLSFVPEARRAELIYLVRQDCGSCHGLTLRGGLGPPLEPAALADKPDQALADVILNGVPGTPMPPWAFQISAAEAAWLVRSLKEGLADDH